MVAVPDSAPGVRNFRSGAQAGDHRFFARILAVSLTICAFVHILGKKMLHWGRGSVLLPVRN